MIFRKPWQNAGNVENTQAGSPFQMAIKRKNGYKFSETALGAFLDGEKEREGKFRSLGWIFAVLFGLPMLFLVLGLFWKGIKWVMSVMA